VQLSTDAMPDEINRDGEVRLLSNCLELTSNTAPSSTWYRSCDSVLEHRFSARNECMALSKNLSNANGDRAVGTPTIEPNAHVNRDEVTVLNDACAWNPMHEFLVHADASRGWKRGTRLRRAAISNKQGLTATSENRVMRGLVDF